MNRVAEVAISSTLFSSCTNCRTCSPAIPMHAFPCTLTLPNVPQVNSAIAMARDDQLRVARYWRDTRGATAHVVTRTYCVNYLDGVYEAHFNSPQCVNCHQPIADNRDTPVYKHDVPPIITNTYDNHIRSARRPHSRCACRARALYRRR